MRSTCAAVERLTYEAYEELALAEMAAVAEEARARFGALVAVVHRTGAVEIGEPSVAVAASAGHRPEAFAACRYVIDEVKRRVPIWKRTDYADGASSWVDGCAPRPPPGRNAHDATAELDPRREADGSARGWRRRS